MSPIQGGAQIRPVMDAGGWAADLARIVEQLDWKPRRRPHLDVPYSVAKRELHLAVHDTAHETSLALMQGRLQAKRIFDVELTRLRHRLGVSQ